MHRSLWRNELVATEAARLGLTVLGLTGRKPVEALVERVVDTVGIRRNLRYKLESRLMSWSDSSSSRACSIASMWWGLLVPAMGITPG